MKIAKVSLNICTLELKTLVINLLEYLEGEVYDQLEAAIQDYLNWIVSFSYYKLAINEQNLKYLEQRIRAAFSYELGNKQISLQPDENRNLILNIYQED